MSFSSLTQSEERKAQMDFPSNPNFCESHGTPNAGIPEQNVHVNNLTLTTAQIELMRRQPVFSDPLFHGGNSVSNNSTNLTSGEQDLPGTNQTRAAAETGQMMMRQQKSGQRQPADISSADSSEQNHHPVNNQSTAAETEPMRRRRQLQLPDISSADSPAVQPDKKRKARREADQRYKAKLKKEREEMKLKVTTLEAEKELSEAEIKSLRVQLDFENKARDKLQEDFVEMKKKYEKEHKQREDMELKVTTLEAKKEQFEAETKSLKKQLDFANQRCETKERELDKQHESKQTLEAAHRRLTDKYIELLEKSNPLVDPRFGIQSKEPGRQHGQTTNLSSERDFCGSGIDTITQ